MKTFWLMICGSAVLTVALVFVAMYRMSKPDSTGQPQNTSQVQKQHISENIPAKETSGRPVSELPKPATVDRHAVATVNPGTLRNSSGKERINKAQHRELTAINPQWRYNNTVGAMGPELPKLAMGRQGRTRSTENNVMIQGITNSKIINQQS